MGDPTTPPPTIEAQVKSLEDALALQARVDALRVKVEALQVQHDVDGGWEDGRWRWLVVGFGALGLCVGLISGLSVQSGISEKLLTGVLTFVTGGLLTYSGFRWRRGVDAAHLDPKRVGGGIAAFSILVILGVMLGIAMRDNKWLVTDATLDRLTAGSSGEALKLGGIKSGKPSASARSSKKSKAAKATGPAAPKPAAPKTDGMGALRGDSPAELRTKANGIRDDDNARNALNTCEEHFERHTPLLTVCAARTANLGADGWQADVEAILRTAKVFKADERDLREAREAITP